MKYLKDLTQNEIDEIIILLEDGNYIRKDIAEKFNTSRKVIENIVKKYNVKVKRRNQYYFTDQQIKEIKNLALSGMMQKDIAKKYNVPPSIIKNILLKNNISYKKKYNEEYLLINIKKLCAEGESILNISKILNASETKVRTVIKNNNIEIVKSKKNNMGKKFIPENKDDFINMYIGNDYSLNDIAYFYDVTENTILRYAKSLGLSKGKTNFITEGDKIILKELIKNKTLKEIASIRRCSEKYIKIKLWKLGLSNELPINKNRSDFLNTNDFLNDYCDPYLSHSALSMKYGIKASKIAYWRRKDFGKNFLQVNSLPNNYNTSYELKVKEILEELDIAYIQQKQIDKYKVDFYLGQKLCIECNGSFFHSIEKDNDRNKYLIDNNYKILYLYDQDFIDYNTLKQKIINYAVLKQSY